MSTFDIQSIAPEGYEVVNVEDRSAVPITALAGHEIMSFEARVTMRKKWTPKVGEVIAVRDSDSVDWEFDVFEGFRDGEYYSVEGGRDYWYEYRKQTPEERGE